jgi:S-adenosylmethionine:tRNA ribosyltransferase-isomerase
VRGPARAGTDAGGSAPGEAPILLSDYDYILPPAQIAQEPAPIRDQSKLMVLDRLRETADHASFADLPGRLEPGDLVVLNDTRVFPARIEGRKATGGRMDFLLVREQPRPGVWEALCEGVRELRPGMTVRFGEASAEVLGRSGESIVLAFPAACDVRSLLARCGSVPLPPYIRRAASDRRSPGDAERYQTVYARHAGSVAAPTAGLHFTAGLMQRLGERGVRLAFLTLDVGPGTFLPIRTEDARSHRIHAERFRLPEATAAAILDAKRRGGRIVAVGTTTARVLEQAAGRDHPLGEDEGECTLYVLPGHRFRCVDALITNFHLPRSTLLLFVCAFAGRERTLAAYRRAVESGYRFYSYGDAMLIL